MTTLKILTDWITSSYGKHVIAKHLARVLLYKKKGLDALYPKVKQMAWELQKTMKDRGKPIVIVETFRDVPRQVSLSSSVTNASELQSYHQYGLAFDVMFKGHRWDPPDNNWWYELGEEGEKLGLIWGGRWTIGDMGHFEWHGVKEEFTWKKLGPHFK